jgi:tetratricopeptide (TPR) repeat protein
MSAQSEGEYAEALLNYYEAMRLEIDPYDRSYILYNIGLIHTSNGEHAKALEYYFQALERNPSLPQALNNMAVICHYVRLFVFIYLRSRRDLLFSINNKFITCISDCDI